jgi:Arc/MetJ-type ribon-helix-helix transcriptional regulator
MASYPPDLELYVQATVASGKFRTRDEFAIEAARLYREIETRHQQLKTDVQAAIDEADRGESEVLDIDSIKQELVDELDSRGRPH